jgi:glutamine amidotransferase
VTIAIVDVGLGNPGSVANMLRKVGAEAVRTDDAAVLVAADAVVLPGVGAFDVGMARLHEHGLVQPLGEQVVDAGRPVLGICLGMQLLAEGSEEGRAAGLGWVPGMVRRLPAERPDGTRQPVPHMGWNVARPVRSGTPFDAAGEDARFYFVHSYAFEPADGADVLATTTYGIDFCSAVRRGNVTGVQFHPEKSHRHGLAFLRRFTEEVAECTARG